MTPATISSTICAPWLDLHRAPAGVGERAGEARQHGLIRPARARLVEEYDHLVPLELGGAANDPGNLWPEPDYATRAGFYLNPEDHLSGADRLVCSGRMTLHSAQLLIARDWVGAYRTYG